ncbi:hypothetical protein PI124_g8854 [Phytophthora idaei]|nr:hypothetical protein PI125_g8463 [Phytophthora idaei]KAG3163452.1 hypothetical protein PI126_g5553 [Phytophthora idaei]KAG3246440.1 hypothetical protein PI124_g8854 [Phytophthora idaei]
MLKRIPLRELAIAAEANLEGLKSFDIAKSNALVCTVCTHAAAPHKTRYRLLKCSSEACSTDTDVDCGRRGKLFICLITNRASIYDNGVHTTVVSSPNKKKRLTGTQKTFCREETAHHLRPMCIRHALSRKFETPLENLPKLQVVQNFENYYSRTGLQKHDRVDEIREWVHARTYAGSEAMDQAFTFGCQSDLDDKPIVENGAFFASPVVLCHQKGVHESLRYGRRR